MITELPMKVDLVAWTHFDAHLVEKETEWSTDAEGAEALIEAAGRQCYESWSKPNPVTATNAGYMGNILDHQHFSVLRHSQATFWIRGVSRALSHEMVRHPHLAFSELSQRFVDVSDAQYVVPPALADLEDGILAFAAEYAKNSYEILVDLLVDEGKTRKQAREAARAVMPNMTETRFFVTGNLQAWRDFITRRSSIHADDEMRHVANLIAASLKVNFPNVFQDMKLRFPEGKATWQFVPKEEV